MKRKFEKFKTEEVVRSLRDYFEGKPEIIVAYLFGSVAESRQNQLSDVDVAVLVERHRLATLEKKPLGYQAGLTTDLMALLNTNDVDVLILNYATPLLAYDVVKYGKIILSRNEDTRVEFEIRTRHRYLDTKPLREIQDFYFGERVRKGLAGKRRSHD